MQNILKTIADYYYSEDTRKRQLCNIQKHRLSKDKRLDGAFSDMIDF